MVLCARLLEVHSLAVLIQLWRKGDISVTTAVGRSQLCCTCPDLEQKGHFGVAPLDKPGCSWMGDGA
ncbi:unnamed protein product [Cylicostephanus goldi]|uniref:Uncharacterized protein n=1 Tax=Cylicostephanus goldi TaxID=71465 RepID=A0A3P6UD29_CYLGO|nr:unnamed protein product [Cylicostephanus goldi]